MVSQLPLPLADTKIVLGVSGGIAAYKAISLLRLLTESGANVHVVPTQASLKFVGVATWEALSGNSVHLDVFEDVEHVAHVALGQQADVVVVAPATANTLARAVSGSADNLLGATLLVTRAPVVMFPAMHTEMWEHPATQANVTTLRERGVHVAEPAVGRLTGADSGKGRLPEPEAMFEYVVAAAKAPRVGRSGSLRSAEITQDLDGQNIVISAGGTREPLDPVRYITNRSSGKQGWALAQAAVVRGASVTLIAANVALPPVIGVAEFVSVTSALELEAAVREHAQTADVVIMAAAVSDYRPVDVAAHKMKKTAASSTLSLELTQNPDILAGLVSHPVREGQRVVGFAAETGSPSASALDLARAKVRRKGCDLLVANDVSAGKVFGRDSNTVAILNRDAEVVAEATGSKVDVAHVILSALSSS